MNKGVGYGYGQWQYLPSGLQPSAWANMVRPQEPPTYDEDRSSGWLSSNPGIDAAKWSNRIALVGLPLALGLVLWFGHATVTPPTVPHVTYSDTEGPDPETAPASSSVLIADIQVRTCHNCPWTTVGRVVNPDGAGEMWIGPAVLGGEVRVRAVSYVQGNLRWHTHVVLGKWFVQVWSVPS